MTTDTTPSSRGRRTDENAAAADPASVSPKPLTKLDQIEALLLADSGASIAEMMAATGWQQHSLRGAMAGALRRRGLTITSNKVDGLRRYCAGRLA